MRSPTEPVEEALRMGLAGGLAQEMSIEGDVSVDSEDGSPLPRLVGDGLCLQAGVFQDERFRRRPASQFLDLRRGNLELNASRGEQLPPPRRRGGQDQAPNQVSISRSADSSESEPWTRLYVTSVARSPRIEPGAASSGLVAPITCRAAATASGPSRIAATSGPPVMKSTRSQKNGFSACSA